MTSRQQLTEIAVASTLAARAMPDLDHDEIGIWTIRSYETIARDGVVFSADETVAPDRLITAAEISEETVAKLQSLVARAAASGKRIADMVDETVPLTGPYTLQRAAFASALSSVESRRILEIGDADFTRLVDSLDHTWDGFEGVTFAVAPAAMAATFTKAESKTADPAFRFAIPARVDMSDDGGQPWTHDFGAIIEGTYRDDTVTLTRLGVVS